MGKNIVFFILSIFFVYNNFFINIRDCAVVKASDVKPGDVIDKYNWQKAQELLTKPYLKELKEGLVTFRIVKTRPVRYPKVFWEATRKYAGNVSLDAEGGLVNYVAGAPFPNIDTSDPQAGTKLIWNEFWHWMADDYYLSDGFRWCTNPQGQEITARMCQAQIRTTGKVSLEPMPAIPGFENVEHFFVNMNLHPRDAAGTTVMTKRYSSPLKEDDMWIYIPSLRRVRRFPTSQRCSTIAPTVYTNDDIYGFRGKISRFKYKLLGEKKLLALCHQKHHPIKHHKGSGIPQDEDWEIRDIWIVEQIPKDPSYCYSKRILNVDKEFWDFPFVESFDRKGEFWKLVPGHIYTISYNGEKWIRKPAGSGGGGFDFQTGHKTFTFYNASFDTGITPGEFSLSNMVRAARMGRFR